jgi:hypothetical protein
MKSKMRRVASAALAEKLQYFYHHFIGIWKDASKMRTIFALINKYGEARKVVSDLLDKNFEKDDINVIAQKSAVENQWDVNERTISIDVSDNFGEQAELNLDTILGRHQPIPTNAAGELYAAGEVARILARTVAIPGSEEGGLEGAFKDFGIGGSSAQAFANGIHNGELLLFLRAEDERVSEVQQILNQVSASHISTLNG